MTLLSEVLILIILPVLTVNLLLYLIINYRLAKVQNEMNAQLAAKIEKELLAMYRRQDKKLEKLVEDTAKELSDKVKWV